MKTEGDPTEKGDHCRSNDLEQMRGARVASHGAGSTGNQLLSTVEGAQSLRGKQIQKQVGWVCRSVDILF